VALRARSLAPLLAASLVELASGTCRADDLPVHLVVRRGRDTTGHDASGCPDAAALAASIGRARGHGTPDVTPGADARLRLEVAMSRTASGYHATVQIMGARIGVREIEHTGPTCDPLAKALVVSLAVLIDDVEQSVAQDQPPPEPAPEAPPAAASSTPPSTPPPAAPEADGPSLAIRRSAQASPPPPPPEVPSPLLRTAFNSLFVELGGPALVYSIDYERLLGQSNLSVRVGFGFIHLTGTFFGTHYNEEDISVPALLSYYLGTPTHKIQLGLGAVVRHREDDFDSGSSTAGLFTVALGYRYLPPDGGVNFGVAFTPMFGADPKFLPWASASVGFGY
jgi:hypothetical protein